MKTKKTMEISSCNKSELFDGLIGTDDSVIDPSYKLYLEHLTKGGFLNSEENCQMKTKETMDGSSHNKGKLFGGLTDADVSEMDPSYKFYLEHLDQDGFLNFEGNCQRDTKKTENGSSCNKSKLFNGLIGTDVSEIDPSYKLYLENLSKDGNTIVLDVPNGDHGLPVSVRYEEEDASYVNALDKSAPILPSSSLQPCITAGKAANGNVGKSFPPKTSSVKKTPEVDESYELFLSLVKFKDGSMVIEPEPGVTIVYEQEPAGCDDLRAGSSPNDLEYLMSPLENVEEGYAMPMHTYEDGPAQADRFASEDEMIGPSSENLDGQDVVCTDKRGLLLDTKPSDIKECENNEGAPPLLSFNGSSTFDEKLSAVLSQPYDQNEYEELWRKATDRKPVSRQRHLRRSSKRYVTKEIGLSYLDYHPDLAVQIDSADHHERLILLRKFFFWLENLCHEGAYAPWISRTVACDPISADEYEPVTVLQARQDEACG